MFNFDGLRRPRVFFEHEHGLFAVRIERHNDRLMYVFQLVVFTAAFAFFMSIFTRPLLNDFQVSTILLISPFVLFFLVWYTLALRVGLWRAFGIERIVVHGGTFQWNRTALFWQRNVEIPTTAISEIKAVTPWHGLSNHVEFTVHNKQQAIGDMLLRDEATELASKLREVVGLA
jgi:hypothetical protein